MEFEKIKCGDELIVIPTPRSYSDCVELIHSDYFRYTGKRTGITRIFMRGLVNPSVCFTFWLRLSSFRSIFSIIPRIMHRHYSHKFGLHISPQTKIGYGLYLGHGMNVVISPSAVIGNNCNLSQFTNIGSNKNTGAVIGNNVYVGPGVCIVEDVSIGSNSTIGAGAVVVKSIPQGTTAAGVPAKVISNSSHSEYIGNRWCIDK